MTIRKKRPRSGPIVIDLTGPSGNAFVLMGHASKWADTLGYTPDEKAQLLDDMRSGNYEHLLEVFDDHFGDFVILER